MLLALDTSSDMIAVALHDGERVVASRTTQGSFAHAERLVPLIEALLTDTDATTATLESMVVGVGPGPYTGLRVGIATALTMGFSLGIPVLGACSLDGLAWQAALGGLKEPFAVATDARRHEVYLATYDAAGVRVADPSVCRPAAVKETIRLGPVVGAGALLYAETFGDPRPPSMLDAGALADLVVRMPSARCAVTPLYLRRPDAVEVARVRS